MTSNTRTCRGPWLTLSMSPPTLTLESPLFPCTHLLFTFFINIIIQYSNIQTHLHQPVSVNKNYLPKSCTCALWCRFFALFVCLFMLYQKSYCYSINKGNQYIPFKRRKKNSIRPQEVLFFHYHRLSRNLWETQTEYLCRILTCLLICQKLTSNHAAL